MNSFIIHQSNVQEGIVARQATPEDTEAVLALLLGTAKWLQSTGSTQWSALLRGEDSHDTPAAIRRGETFVFAAEDGELAGVFILMQQPSPWDRDLWGELAENGESAFYLHRLAINRRFAGRRLGEAMMRWAESGIQFGGKTLVRLDCIASNEALNRFYSGLGYAFRGATNGFNLYEKPTASR
ncbi:GNAT family N-acetyltransferase [Paenibacillus xanthanilyticus]|uniref:GNAT family N-acetyltransferase n=1 Tax=Paenibacillus xanthanilyticus TaxID=1783531 RepID=A0ABV8K0E6_9BACL